MRSFVAVVLLMTMSHNDGTLQTKYMNCLVTFTYALYVIEHYL